MDTPDAVDVLLHRIRKDAKKISGEHQGTLKRVFMSYVFMSDIMSTRDVNVFPPNDIFTEILHVVVILRQATFCYFTSKHLYICGI